MSELEKMQSITREMAVRICVREWKTKVSKA